MCLHAKAYTSKYSANYVPGVCRRLPVWAPLPGQRLTCRNVTARRWLGLALRGDPACGLRAETLRRTCQHAGLYRMQSSSGGIDCSACRGPICRRYLTRFNTKSRAV
jgi:hypothetical protein